jgi:hypothetical protein
LRSRMKFPHTIHCSIQGTGKRLGAREARCARFCFRPNTWKRILSVKPCFWRPCGGPIYAGVGIQPKSLTHQCARLQSLHRIRAPSTLRDFVPRIAFLFLEYFRPLPTGQTPVAYAIRALQLFEFRIWDGTWGFIRKTDSESRKHGLFISTIFEWPLVSNQCIIDFFGLQPVLSFIDRPKIHFISRLKGWGA